MVEPAGNLDPAGAVPVPGRLNRRRAAAGGIVVVAAIAAAAFAVYKERHSFSHSLGQIGVWPLVASLALATAGVACSGPMWLAMADGLGVHLGLREGSRVFFVTQLGKYLPGSVWPALMQMEAGHARGASRRVMLAANLLTIALTCGVGLLVAGLVLPLSDAGALKRYWWGLAAVPVLIALLHPKVLPSLMDRAFAAVHRPRLGVVVNWHDELRAAAWSLGTWVGYGSSVGILCIALGQGGPASIALGIGGMALAVPLGILFIPAPAGAGIRDVVLTLVLESRLPPGPALAVVVLARVIIIASDLIVALAASSVGRRR